MDVSRSKNNSQNVDFIIVGHGLAGSVLAIHLIKAGYKICVIDEPGLSSSSKVAAGIWNPVVFKRLTKSWLADELVPELIDFYTRFGKETQTDLITLRNIIKPFTEDQEKSLWQKKAQIENQFLDKTLYQDLQINSQEKISSYSKVLNAGNLDMLAFLEASKNYICSKYDYVSDKFDYEFLEKDDFGISYKGHHAKNIIFAEGYLISQNPYFNWIPMKPAKGEVLTIYCEDLLIERDILNKGIFIMPLGNHQYKVGATYEWNELNDQPTEKAKKELQEKLAALIKVPFQIMKHEAGVRPAVVDRRPVIGRHPEYSNLYVFNGFGTKAVMLAPYFAKHFMAYLEDGISLNTEVDVKRFFGK